MRFRDNIELFISQTITAINKHGLLTVSSRAIGELYDQTVRRYLPITGQITRAGVVTDDERLFDTYLPKEWQFAQDDPLYKSGYLPLHRNLIQPRDTVVIVGGGRGVSAVSASKQVGSNGKIIIFEGSHEQCLEIYDTLLRNNCENNYTIKNNVVGPGINVYTDDKDTIRSIDPSNIPECDVLELDCEGAEYTILEKMEIRPRVLLVELHPWSYSGDPAEILKQIDNIGYKFSEFRDNHGNNYDYNNFVEYLNSMSTGQKGPSPVVIAVRE